MRNPVPQVSRVLVTGGAGFIGATVARRLMNAGHHVTIVDNGADERQVRARSDLPDAHWVAGDLLEIDLVPLLERTDRVVHLAGRPGVQGSWGGGFEQHLRANTLLTQRLLEAAVVAQPHRVIVASSSSVYGEIANGLAHESMSPSPLSPYGVSKAAVEQLVGAYAARGVEAVALRYFTVYGRGQRPDMALARVIEAALGGDPFPMRGTGRQARDFTHVDDTAAATEAALFAPDLPAGTICNVGGGRPASLNTLLSIVERQLGRPVPRFAVGEAHGDPTRTAADPSRARELLGWAASVDLEDGVADQIAHHRSPGGSHPSQPADAPDLVSAP